MTSGLNQVSAYILHTRPYQESSLILQVFSLQLGRFSLIAKGVKGKKSQARKAILQPFQELLLDFTGRSELKTLTHCELAQDSSKPVFSMSQKKLACAYYANEILTRALPEKYEYPELFYCYRELLNKLGETDALAPLLRQFEVAMLLDIGLMPDCLFDVDGTAIDLDAYYQLLPESGFVRVAGESKSTNFPGSAILALAGQPMGRQDWSGCQQICRQLLQQVIGDKPLQSRKMWQHITLNQP